jgi:hypothetical protein
VVIRIVIPTVSGRSESLRRCLDAYLDCSRFQLDFYIAWNRETCGHAWIDGAEEDGNWDFLHLTADDLEPHKGWDVAAVTACGLRTIPAPVVQKADGRFESSGGYWDRVHGDWDHTDGTVVIPFCSREQYERIRPLLAVHYYSDNWFTFRARKAGYSTVVRTSYRFTHHWEQAGRGAGMTQEERMIHDRAIYEEAVRCSS